jgi:hypothetical protein
VRACPESTVGELSSAWEKHSDLARGISYKVIAPFTDADGDHHGVGEVWTFEGAWFSKFDDRVDMFVMRPDGSHWRIPLLWKVGAQASVIEQLSLFLSSQTG